MTKLKKKKTKIHIASQGLLKKIMNFNQVVEIAFPGCSENDGIPPSLNSTKLGKHQPPTTWTLPRASAGFCTGTGPPWLCAGLESSCGKSWWMDGKLNVSQRCPGSHRPGEPGKGGWDCPALLWPGVASAPVLGQHKVTHEVSEFKGGQEDCERSGGETPPLWGLAEVGLLSLEETEETSLQSAISLWGEGEEQTLISSLSWPVTAARGTARAESGQVYAGCQERFSPRGWLSTDQSPQEVITAPSLTQFNKGLDNSLGQMLSILGMTRTESWTPSFLGVSSNSAHSMIHSMLIFGANTERVPNSTHSAGVSTSPDREHKM